LSAQNPSSQFQAHLASFDTPIPLPKYQQPHTQQGHFAGPPALYSALGFSVTVPSCSTEPSRAKNSYFGCFGRLLHPDSSSLRDKKIRTIKGQDEKNLDIMARPAGNNDSLAWENDMI
jgi:hypothetical protein